MLERIIQAYLTKKAGPVVLRPDKFPYLISPGSRAEKHRNFWTFMDEHQVELNADEQSAVENYRDHCGPINWHLRGMGAWSHKFSEEELEDQVHHINRAIAKSPMKRPVLLWRGINFKAGEPITDRLVAMGLVDPFLGGNWTRVPTKAELDSLVGFKFREPAFSSTSLSPGQWAQKSIRLRILLDRGQSGLVMNSAYHYSTKSKSFLDGIHNEFADEHEVLLSSGTLFEVESVRFERRGDHSQLFVTVRVVD